jgi:hypothetical protein
MDTPITQRTDNDYRSNLVSTSTSADSAVAWCAVFAGAVASTALSLILLFLGTGFGLTLVSPWSTEGISATSFGVSSILGITVISLLASALGGYLAGRLRTRWINTPSDEVFFRDTAHGFLSWSVATLVTAALLTSVIGSIIGGGVKTGAAIAGTAGVAGAAAVAAHDNGGNDKSGMGVNNISMPYLLDSLLRKDDTTLQPNNSQLPSNTTNPPDTAIADTATNAPAPTTANNPIATRGNSPKAEISRIFFHALATDSLTQNDLKYTGRLVAQAANIDQQTAEKRVADTFFTLQSKWEQAKKDAKEAADKARKVSASVSLWLFISLLSGAFIASLMAVYGGRQRDF